MPTTGLLLCVESQSGVGGTGGAATGGPGSDTSARGLGAEVVAVRGGEIVESGWRDLSDHSVGLGWRTKIADPTGVDVYGHLDPKSTLSVGTKVGAGDVIGRIANPTNGFSSGPHVHLGPQFFSEPGIWVNPGKMQAIVGRRISLGFARAHPLFKPAIRPHYGIDWAPR